MPTSMPPSVVGAELRTRDALIAKVKKAFGTSGDTGMSGLGWQSLKLPADLPPVYKTAAQARLKAV